MISVYVTAHSTHFAYTIWAVRFLDLPIDDTRHFPTKTFFIDENVIFYVRYFPKQTRYFSYVMIIATTFTVCFFFFRVVVFSFANDRHDF